MSKIKKAWLVDGLAVEELTALEGKELSFATMYPIIGCEMIEHVGLGKGVDMWVDEEGLYKNPIVNPLASEMYRDAYPHIPRKDLGIVGKAIVTDNTKVGNFINKYAK